MRNILICSADEDLLTALHAASGTEGVRLMVRRSGMDAVRALMVLSFDRLILDLETPGLDALFMVSMARRIDPHLPVVAVSRGPVGQAREIQHKGIAHHLVPPTASPEIAQMIALGVEPVAAGVQQIG
jgi:DNA-binding NtrC family response regulator